MNYYFWSWIETTSSQSVHLFLAQQQYALCQAWDATSDIKSWQATSKVPNAPAQYSTSWWVPAPRVPPVLGELVFYRRWGDTISLTCGAGPSSSVFFEAMVASTEGICTLTLLSLHLDARCMLPARTYRMKREFWGYPAGDLRWPRGRGWEKATKLGFSESPDQQPLVFLRCHLDPKICKRKLGRQKRAWIRFCFGCHCLICGNPRFALKKPMRLWSWEQCERDLIYRGLLDLPWRTRSKWIQIAMVGCVMNCLFLEFSWPWNDQFYSHQKHMNCGAASRSSAGSKGRKQTEETYQYSGFQVSRLAFHIIQWDITSINGDESWDMY